MNKPRPIRANVVVLKQLLNLIPRGMINRHALETGVEAKARSFSGVSQMEELNLRRETFQPNWNYSLSPKSII